MPITYKEKDYLAQEIEAMDKSIKGMQARIARIKAKREAFELIRRSIW